MTHAALRFISIGKLATLHVSIGKFKNLSVQPIGLADPGVPIDYVEIDSSFYRIPSPFMVKNWYRRGPQNFRFTTNFPKIITHDKRLRDVDKELERFFEAMHPLADKTLALLIQLSPSLQILEGLQRLRDLVPELDNIFRYALEVRYSSWFQDLAYNFFCK